VGAPSREIPVLRFESLDSTNEEALRQLATGAAPPLWIVADEQQRGRGRGGRLWTSPKGNLYATLLIRTSVPPSISTQLSFVAALAAHDATAARLPAEQISQLRLKWPNDVMLNGAKLAGVLLESMQAPSGGGLAVIAGAGINVSHAPQNMGRPTASLGLAPSAVEEVFRDLAAAFQRRLALWDEGLGFPRIREAWLSRALALNEAISVNLNGSAIRGKFLGVDPAGALQLETAPGLVITVTAGDIYPDALL
jgi:BirA family transcriptional regulator, biotin operon repressor / biotin---[acetyl-CoA-carboxylase] ligase